MTAPFSAFAVGDYDDAKAWLWRYSRPEEWMHNDADELPLEAKLVCDVFWIPAEALLEDMRALFKRSSRPSPPAPLRRGRRMGGF